MKRAKNFLATIWQKYPFEGFVFIIFILYTALCLSPSSYGLVLNMFGFSGEGLLWGTPRSIRSDEWAVWTPYFQSVVNNDFSRFNSLSLYQEDFRGFSALPIYDWGIFFKPLLWPFLIFKPAYAFSIHHALVMVAFILGWKHLIDRLLPTTQKYCISALFALLLFFSGFVQTWWTTLGPVIALTPWLFITLLWCEKISWKKAIVFWYVSVAWILSHTYPPVIISSVYVACVLALCFRPALINIKSILALSLSGALALAICYFYLQDGIHVMASTVYPGQRISHAGELPWQIWLSAFIPYITHSYYQPLLDSNICEISVISSLLPTMALVFINYSSLNTSHKKIAAIFIATIIIMSLWMLGPFPQLLAKALLLDRVPGPRLLWGLGLSINIFALYMLASASIKLTLTRATIFFVVILCYYSLSTYMFDLSFGKKSAIELLAPLAIIFLAIYAKRNMIDNSRKLAALLVVAAGINVIYFSAFNPAQSAKPIFSLKNSSALEDLKSLQQDHPKDWLVVSGYPGAVLQGLGLNAITHVLMMPKLEFFQSLFPDMEAQQFNNVFNRYAHIHLSNEDAPYSPQADVIRVPQSVFGVKKQEPSIIDITPLSGTTNDLGGYIDIVEISDNQIILRGWGMISSKESVFHTNLNGDIGAVLERSRRPDVVAALKDTRLSQAGFSLTFTLDHPASADDLLDKLCLYTQDVAFGVKQLQSGNPNMQYQCK